MYPQKTHPHLFLSQKIGSASPPPQPTIPPPPPPPHTKKKKQTSLLSNCENVSRCQRPAPSPFFGALKRRGFPSWPFATPRPRRRERTRSVGLWRSSPCETWRPPRRGGTKGSGGWGERPRGTNHRPERAQKRRNRKRENPPEMSDSRRFTTDPSAKKKHKTLRRCPILGDLQLTRAPKKKKKTSGGVRFLEIYNWPERQKKKKLRRWILGGLQLTRASGGPPIESNLGGVQLTRAPKKIKTLRGCPILGDLQLTRALVSWILSDSF